MSAPGLQIRKRSLSTRFLVSFLGVVILVILLFEWVTLTTLSEQKRRELLLVQTNQVGYLGDKILGVAEQGVGHLRNWLSQNLNDEKLRALHQNQSTLLDVAIYEQVGESWSRRNFVSKGNSPLQRDDSFSAFDLFLPVLREQRVAFLHASTSEALLMGVLYYEAPDPSKKQMARVAYGLLDLAPLIRASRGLDAKVATRDGRVLFDTNTAALLRKEHVRDDPLYQEAIATSLSLGSKEYETDEVGFIGTFAKPGFDLVVLSRTERQELMRPTYELLEKNLWVGIIIMGATIFLAIALSRQLTDPIVALYSVTRSIARGNFSVRLPFKSDDEIGDLAESFEQMSDEIQELIQEREEKVRIENELKLAASVQHLLVPPSEMESDRFLIGAHYESAGECGGDWWGEFSLGRHHVFLIGDATGHGISSALLTAALRGSTSILQQMCEKDPELRSPADLLHSLNRVVYEVAQGQLMMTFFVAVIDDLEGTITYANAGHNPPYFGSVEKGNVRSLMARGPRLGDKADLGILETKRVSVTSDDILILYTDGLIEGTNAEGEQFGKKRFRAALEEDLVLDPSDLARNVVGKFREFHGNGVLEDDLTLVIVRFQS